MDIIAFCEANPDWIQFSNAHVQLQRYRGAYVTFLERAPLGLLGPSDVLIVVGHGSGSSVGDYGSAAALVTVLMRQGLRNNGATVRFQTCSPADLHMANPILQQIKNQLTLQGRGTITVQGGTSPSITGWRHTTERLVPYASFDRVALHQRVSSFQNEDQIQRAISHINQTLRANSSSGELIAIARVVHTYTSNFFVDFARRAEVLTISPDVGFRTL